MNNIAIGLSGAHRTGKTTLAKELAKKMGMNFSPSFVSKIFEKRGFDPRSTLPIMDRLTIQQEILDAHVDTWLSASGGFVTDRTYLDFIAYTLCNVRQEDLNDPVVNRMLNKFIDDVEEATMCFEHIFVLRPGIGVMEEPGKASTNWFHIKQLDTAICGTALDMMSRFDVEDNAILIMPDEALELNHRVELIKGVIENHYG